MTTRSLPKLCSMAVAALVACTFAEVASAQLPPPPPTTPPAPGYSPMQPGAAPAYAAPPVGGVAGYSPPKLEWDKGDPIPPGYHPSTEIRTGFVIAGGVTLGVSYAFGGIIPAAAGLSCCGEFAALLVPGVGPFIFMAVVGAESKGADANITGPIYAIFAVDGLVQTAGAVMLIYGLAAQRDVLVRNDKVGKTTITWQPAPMSLGDSGSGIGVRGTF